MISLDTAHSSIIRKENRRQAQPEQTKNDVDDNTTEWSGLGYVEATRKARTGTTGGNSLHPTQQWNEPDDDD